MGGKIEIYLDVASLFSYVAFAYLQQHAEELTAQKVEIEYHPVLIGAINHLSGNKPPWTLPAKGAYLKLDSARSLARVSLPADITMPPDFMARANTLLPIRALTHLKNTSRDSPSVLTSALSQLFKSFWVEHVNINDPQTLVSALVKCPGITEDQARSAVAGAGDIEVKAQVKSRTQEAVDRGAFGAPWIWATDDSGKSEPFFGSDRFHFVYQFLGVPYEDLKMASPAKKGKL